MRPMKKPLRDIWPSWRYAPDGHGEVFHREEDVPQGWTRKPLEPEVVHVPPAPVRLDRAALIAALDAKGVHLDARWSAAHMKNLLEAS
jgi:hypothetical protein